MMSSTINRRTRRTSSSHRPLVLPTRRDSPSSSQTASKRHHHHPEYGPVLVKIALLGTIVIVWFWISIRTTIFHNQEGTESGRRGGGKNYASPSTFFSSRSMLFSSTMHYIKPEVIFPRLVVLRDKMMMGSTDADDSDDEYSRDDDKKSLLSKRAKQDDQFLKLPRKGRYVSHMGDKHMFKKIKSSKDYRALDEYVGQDESDCQLPFEWQKTSYPACNSMHELDLTNPSTEHGTKKYKMLTNGYYRDVWSLQDAVQQAVVFKPMRIMHKFSFRNMDRMRRDALAMDRLTGEKYILDIYGYCATSGVFEYADGGDVEQVIWPSHSRSRSHPSEELPRLQKLHIGEYNVSRKLAVLHFCIANCFVEVHTHMLLLLL